jgi:hypothetical protein
MLFALRVAVCSEPGRAPGQAPHSVCTLLAWRAHRPVAVAPRRGLGLNAVSDAFPRSDARRHAFRLPERKHRERHSGRHLSDAGNGPVVGLDHQRTRAPEARGEREPEAEDHETGP